MTNIKKRKLIVQNISLLSIITGEFYPVWYWLGRTLTRWGIWWATCSQWPNCRGASTQSVFVWTQFTDAHGCYTPTATQWQLWYWHLHKNCAVCWKFTAGIVVISHIVLLQKKQMNTLFRVNILKLSYNPGQNYLGRHWMNSHTSCYVLTILTQVPKFFSPPAP